MARDRGDPRARYALEPHGTNAKYSLGGCRCPACRAAATAARRARRNGAGVLVNASKARQWLGFLRSQGVGIEAIVDASDLPRSTVHGIRSGRIKRITRETEAQVLRTTQGARAPGALEPNDRIRRYLDHLRDEGFTWRAIGEGCKVHRRTLSTIHRRPRIEVATRIKVERFYRLRVEVPGENRSGGFQKGTR